MSIRKKGIYYGSIDDVQPQLLWEPTGRVYNLSSLDDMTEFCFGKLKLIAVDL